ncbi:ABC transporter permease [Radicibacter daui]|uniref:ABC transporter permease n=1 Tax=Radicibacter daui TaxID=3064829 RepID=UPI004046CAA5
MPARFLRRLISFALTLALTLFGLLAVTFVIARVVPIDPVIALVGDKAPADVYAAARAHLGLDLPLWQQFIIYLRDVLSGNLGSSSTTGNPVLSDIAHTFPATLELATYAIIVGIGLGIPLGVAAAVWQGRWPDHLIRVVSLFGYSVPVFWLGLVALLVFYARLDWVGGPGRLDIAYDYIVEPWSGLLTVDAAAAGEWDVFWNAVSHLVLPVALLAYFSMAYIGRMTRSFMIDELGKEYITTARVKGASEARVIWRHALGNAAVPLITVVALSYAYLLEGAVLTETVFAWPGLGSYITQALFDADMAAVLGGTLVVGASFVALNIFSELVYAWLDPRARMK